MHGYKTENLLNSYLDVHQWYAFAAEVNVSKVYLRWLKFLLYIVYRQSEVATFITFQWCSPRDQGLGLEAPRGQKWKSWSWSRSWRKSLCNFSRLLCNSWRQWARHFVRDNKKQFAIRKPLFEITFCAQCTSASVERVFMPQNLGKTSHNSQLFYARKRCASLCGNVQCRVHGPAAATA